jgi:hypothetical protein
VHEKTWSVPCFPAIVRVEIVQIVKCHRNCPVLTYFRAMSRTVLASVMKFTSKVFTGGKKRIGRNCILLYPEVFLGTLVRIIYRASGN